MKINLIEFASSLQAANRGEFEAYLIGWSGRADPDGNMFSFLTTGGGQNDGHYSNPVVDAALSDARRSTDLAGRRADYETALRQMRRGPADDLPGVARQHRRHVGEVDRVPAGARRHDPLAGPFGDEIDAGHLGTRIAQIIPTLLLVSVLVFCLQQLMPGDPAMVLAGEGTRRSSGAGADPRGIVARSADAGAISALDGQRAAWRPRLFLAHAAACRRADRDQVAGDLATGVHGVLFAVLIGVPAGIVAAVQRNRFWDYLANAIGLAGLSTPTFWLGIMMILLIRSISAGCRRRATCR